MKTKLPSCLSLSKGCTKYGAQMGRKDILPTDPSAKHKVYLRKLRMTEGGAYDSEGAYWGLGNPLWICGGEGIQIFTRAKTRWEAKRNVNRTLPNASFYR